VVAGGDGTIGAAVAAVAGSAVPLGILPLGTLNHFARDLGLPLELEQAVDVVADGHVRQVDVAEINGQAFVNNSSVGLYPFMVAQRNAEQRRTGRGKLLATLPAALRALRGATWHHLDIVADGRRTRVRTPCLFVGNNPYETDLAGFGTRKALDRGELCVHVVRQQTRLGVLTLPFRIALGLADPARDVETFRAAELEVTSRQRHLRVSRDGEIAIVPTPLRYRSRPGALRVFAPRPRPATAGATG
jgi:diacylglycerol kinase family enzyme